MSLETNIDTMHSRPEAPYTTSYVIDKEVRQDYELIEADLPGGELSFTEIDRSPEALAALGRITSGSFNNTKDGAQHMQERHQGKTVVTFTGTQSDYKALREKLTQAREEQKRREQTARRTW
jgi:hypothetical protein